MGCMFRNRYNVPRFRFPQYLNNSPRGCFRFRGGFALFLSSTGFSLISPLWGLLTGWRSRLAEYAADAQAVEEGYGDTLIAALKKLARENLSDLSPSPLLVKLEYSHPTLSQRICAIEKRTRGTA